MQSKQPLVAKYATGLYVATFYAIFVCLLFGGFAGYISRVNLGQDLAADVGGLDTLIFHGTMESELKDRLDAVRERLFELQNRRRDVQVEEARIDGEGKYQTSRQKELFVPISTTIAVNEDILSDEFQLEFRKLYVDPSLTYDNRTEALSGLLSTATFSENAPIEKREAFVKEVQRVLSAVSALKLEISRLNVSFTQVKDSREVLEGDSDNLRKVIEDLEAKLADTSKSLKDEHRALIASFKNSFGGIPYSLIQIPTIILTLLVTIAAGGLGSVVAFTRNFLRGDNGTGSGRLLVNIGEGVAAAIAIFLFAGAGMLMLTQGAAGAQGNVELSPYMVAFIAFVSGFMAEDAFNRIQEAGRNLFRVDDGNSRDRAEDEDSDPRDDGTGNGGTKTPASPNVTD